MRIIRTNLISKPVGLGDIVARALHTLGYEQRPGCGCADRQSRLNQILIIVPAKDENDRSNRD